MAAKKLTGAELDAARKLQEAEIIERDLMILNPDEEENSEVIHVRAKKRVEDAGGSIPAPARGIGYVLDKLPGWQRGVVLLALIAALSGAGLLSLREWFAK